MLSLSNVTEEGDQPSAIRLRVLSRGAGVQSTTLALMAAHGEIGPMPDCAIFADTGWEPKSVYDHLDWLRSPNVLPFPVYLVSAGNIRNQLAAAGKGNRWASIPAFARTVTPAGSKVPVYDEDDDGALVEVSTRRTTRETVSIGMIRRPATGETMRWQSTACHRRTGGHGCQITTCQRFEVNTIPGSRPIMAVQPSNESAEEIRGRMASAVASDCISKR